MPGLARLRRFARRCVDTVRARVSGWTKPRPRSLATGAGDGLVRPRQELLLENALLRHQVIVLSRSVKRPAFTAGTAGCWSSSPAGCAPGRARWSSCAPRPCCAGTGRASGSSGGGSRGRDRPPSRRWPPRRSRSSARWRAANRLWGADRIRGELLKLDIRVSKRTIQRYLRQARPPRRPGQAWATFLRNHAGEIWACDFLPVTDLLFRPLYAFFVIALGSRRVVHVGVTRHPTDAWVAQQLREATPFDERPRFLIRDNDAQVRAALRPPGRGERHRVLRTPIRAPRANATAERFLGSVRRECLDHLLVLGEAHLRRALREYVAYFNHARPHQGLGQRVPAPGLPPGPARHDAGESSPSRSSAGCTTRISAPPEAAAGGRNVRSGRR